MQYDKEQFIWDVINEALAIRENATQEELSLLNYYQLCATRTASCIYGQLTGHCHNDRAIELIQKCCTRYFANGALGFTTSTERMLSNVNGTTVENFEFQRKERVNIHFSAVEIFINIGHRSLNANLIAYLRGETDELDIYF